MRRLSLALLASFSLLLLSSQSEAASDRVTELFAKRDARLLERLERWNAMCERREERRAERLTARGLPQPSVSYNACTTIQNRLAELIPTSPTFPLLPPSNQKPVEDPYGVTSNQKPVTPPKADLLPNQLFTPLSPLPTIETSSKFLLLGQRDKVVGSIKLNPRNEPVQIRKIQITLDSEVESLAAIEVFDEFGYELGNASIDVAASASRNVFSLSLSPTNAYFIDQDDEVIFAFRPQLKDDNSGGTSGETFTINAVVITATGKWTSRDAIVTTTGPDFKAHKTAYTTFKSIERVGKEFGTFSVGTQKQIGSFRFEAFNVADADANPRLLSINFSVSHPTAVTLTNPILRDPIGGSETSCTIASAVITCTSIPAAVGAIEEPRELALYADVDVSGDNSNLFLQVEINRAGGPSGGGDITWTDGVTSFDWVPFAQPIVRGTAWE